MSPIEEPLPDRKVIITEVLMLHITLVKRKLLKKVKAETKCLNQNWEP